MSSEGSSDENWENCGVTGEEQAVQVEYKGKSWIYTLKKPELITKLNEKNIKPSDTATVEVLRKLLSNRYRHEEILRQKQREYIPKKSSFKMADNIQPFNGENWPCFQQQLECYITFHDIVDTKKVPLLLTRLSPKVYETLTHLCTKNPIELKYDDLCKILNNKYSSKQPTALERVAFRNRNQLASENIEDYVLELKKLGNKCAFKDLEDQIKEKLIDGVHSKLIKFELLKANSEMSLSNTITLARTVEAALIQTTSVNKTENEVSDMFFYQQHVTKNIRKKYNKPKQKFHKNEHGSNSTMRCFCCGNNNHLKADCRLKFKFCSECGTQGHIFKVCPRISREKKTYLLEQESEVKDQEDIETSVGQLFKEYEMYSVNVSKVPPHYVLLNIEGKDLQFQLDTGSEVTVIPLKDKNKYLPHFTISTCNVKFRNFDQSLSQPVGILENIPVRYKNTIKYLSLFVANDCVPCIIGRDWLHELNLWPPLFSEPDVFIQKTPQINMCTISGAQQFVKEKYAEVFSPGWGNFKGEKIKFKLKEGATPKCLPVRRVPFAMKDKVKSEISRLLKNGRIVPVEYSQWGTPVVPILKPDGSVRLCGDYKLTVNQHLEVDHFPLPHMEEIFDTLKGGEYFCELDLKEAYLQAPLDIDSQDVTTIVTEEGIYKYLYLPYGVSTGPGSFQRLMYSKLAMIPNTIVFIDNIYIVGKDLADTKKTLSMVLEKLQESEFKLKIEKCKFFQKSIDVFGFTITKNNISVIKSNLEPLLKAEAPKNLTLLRSFLGKVNYYNRFLKDMASVLSPLYECTQKNKFIWSEHCDRAFQLIKQKLSSIDNLRHYDPNLPLILTCDASHTGLGVVLSNRDKQGMVRPIAYASKKLNSREQKYSAIDKEAMAIIFGVTKFYNYTYGRPFELQTDNAALVRIFGSTKGIPKMAAKRLQHYAIFLSAFNYHIKYIKTSENPADFLSRSMSSMALNSQNIIDIHSLCINNTESININYIENSQIEALNWKNIELETKKNSSFSKVIRYMVDGWPQKNFIDKELIPYFNKKNELSVDRGCLFWGYRIVIPLSVRDKVLIELHKSHFGTVKMKQIARSFFWWPNIDIEIEKITQNCLQCLTNHKNPPKGNLKTWPVAPTVWYRLHADFLGPFYKKMYLVVIDSYSKWPEVFEMSSINTARTVEVLKSLFSRFGYPAHLVTDNGPTFTSSDFNNFCKITNIKHTFSPPYHPATNGAAEKFVETFKSHVTKIKESGNTLPSSINLFLFDYRNLPHSTTAVTPARLMLGRELRTRFSFLRPPPIVDKCNEAQEKQAQYASGNRNTVFEVGEKVMVRDYRKNTEAWVQGIILEESIPNVTFMVDVEGAIWKRHINQMLKCGASLSE